MRSMFQDRWSDPIQLDHWGRAPGRPGLYVIGRRRDRHRPIGRSIDNEGKLGGFPLNFLPLYIGASSSEHRGIRTRLASHRRGAGNRHISAALLEGDELWFVYVEGFQAAGFEAIYLHIQAGFQFPFNVRSELTRYLLRVGRELEHLVLPIDPFEQWQNTVENLPHRNTIRF